MHTVILPVLDARGKRNRTCCLPGYSYILEKKIGAVEAKVR